MKVIMLFLNIGFGLLMIVKQITGWAWAKIRGKPYDSGMDM